MSDYPETLAHALVRLEPGSGWDGCAHDPKGSPEMRIQLSIAISMKRIADALHRDEGDGLPTFLDQLHGVLSDASHDHAQRMS